MRALEAINAKEEVQIDERESECDPVRKVLTKRFPLRGGLVVALHDLLRWESGLTVRRGTT